MRTLVEKEIRLLLPAFAGALALAILPIWLWPYNPRNPGAFPSYLYLLGTVMLALSSFGREIGLKTLPFILAQPLERARIWWTKITVLAVLVVLAFDAWWFSGGLRSIQRSALLVPPADPGVFGLLVVVFTAGGLWMTLLVRQTVAAFWLTLLIPLAMMSGIEVIGGSYWMIFTALGLYAVAGFFLARRQFFRVQDTAWTGGVLSIGRARAAGEQCALREHRPWAALFGKELQLQQVTLMGIVCLLVLHLGVVVLRKAGAQVLGKTILSALEMFGGLWLIVPLLAGSQSVADERQLGTLDGLLCLPVSRRIQFAVKMIFVLVLGGLLSGALLCAVESVGSAMGVGANLDIMGISFKGGGIILVCFAFLALSLVGFYASTLTRGIVPALGAGAVASVVFWGIDGFASSWVVPFRRLWPLMAFPALAAAVIWLAFGNFRYVFESGRRWRRNIVGSIAVLMVVSGSAAAVYDRVWELALPLEGPHGPARLATGKPILLGGTWNSSEIAVVLPDGRLWEDRATHDWPAKGASHFVPGSNWVAACAHWRETVGIRSDGTLWVSDKPQPSSSEGGSPPLVQFGVETGWRSVACDPVSLVILLQRNGTMWRWGTNSSNSKAYRGLRAWTPQRLGGKSDWVRILPGARWIYAWERDGTAWKLRDAELYELKPPRYMEVEPLGYMEVELAPGTAARRVPGLDHVHFQSLNTHPSFLDNEAGVRDDGTLWYWNWNGYPSQIGKDSNWAAVTGGFYQLVALKTDGSIWKWNFDPRVDAMGVISGTHPMDRTLHEAPVRMGTHNDWVGLGGCGWMGEVVTLSADGTLWRWRRSDMFASWFDERNRLLAPSRRPAKIENILDARE